MFPKGKRGRTTAQQRQAMQQSARNVTGGNAERVALDPNCKVTKWKLFIRVKCLSGEPWPGRVVVKISVVSGSCSAAGDRTFTVQAPTSSKLHILGRRPCQLKIEAAPDDNAWLSTGSKIVSLPGASQSTVEVEIKAKEVVPEIEIRWADDNSAAPDVKVTIASAGNQTTNRTAWAKWTQSVRPASYGVQADSPSGDQYVLYQNDSPQKSVDLNQGPKHSFKIKRSLVNFHVQNVVAGKAEELVGAKVKIKSPALENETVLEESKALAKFVIPVVKEDQKAEVEILSLTPDGTDALFELIEMVPE